ncbi:MAG: endolytic transglycosylase MltG [Bdellovibrionales bacterium]|nr:endolytic transglycosylase MltG [Bdellovibrionales bacterium]
MKILISFVTFFISFFLFLSFRLAVPLNKKESPNLLIDVFEGQTFYHMAEILKEKNLIRSVQDLKILIWFMGRPHLKKGEYELSASMNLWEIFKILKEGKERSFKVSFPEGFNHYEMVELLRSHNYVESNLFLKGVWDKKLIKKFLKQERPSLEGYLFPDSYYVKKYLPANQLIHSMFENFTKAYQDIAKQTLEIDLTDHQVVTLASLIEKETGLANERALISSVFFNRLKKNMKLQTDPTILYALYLVRGFDIEKDIKKKDILFQSPYNTYVIEGLPPGPIANPGRESLKAVFFPSKSDFLYFVSRNDKSHHFSKTYKEHKKNVFKYQIKNKQLK